MRFICIGAVGVTIPLMHTATQILDHQYLQMRRDILTIAADFDRIERAPEGSKVLKEDLRIANLRQAMQIVLDKTANRAEQMQLLLSDTTPPPKRRKVRTSE